MQQNQHAELAGAIEKNAGKILDVCAHAAEGGAPIGNLLAVGLMEVVERLRAKGSAGARRLGGEVRPSLLVSGFGCLRRECAEAAARELKRDMTTGEMRALDEAMDRTLLAQVEDLERAGAAAEEIEAKQGALYKSILSHDLRGMLNGVVLMLEVIRRDLEQAGAQGELMEDVGLMKTSILDAVSTVERHSYLEKLREGRLEAGAEKVSLREVGDAALAKVSGDAKERGVRFVNEIGKEVVVWSDGEMIGKALVELLENAGRYASAGEVTMWAGKAEVNGKDGWSLSVRDQGPGIERERLEKLIDPVRRLELKDRGLGLVLAAYIARRLGGKLEGESTAKGGTLFRLVAPDQAD